MHRRRRALFGALLWLLGVGCLGAAPPESPAAVATVLCFHTFDSPKVTPYTVSSAQFEAQLAYLKSQRIPVVPLGALVKFLQGGPPLPPRSVIITIDDGYKSARTKAYPLLSKYGYPFTLFVYTGVISRHRNALTWDDLRWLAAHGADIESHTFTHPLLTHPGRAMTHPAYLEWLDDELQQSKKKIEDELQKPVTVLAYPYGGYSATVIERTRLAGYEAAVTCNDGNVARGTDRYHINRRLIYRTTSQQTFADELVRPPLFVDELSPRDGQRLAADRVSRVAGRIANVADILPDSGLMRIDKLWPSAQAIAIDSGTGAFSLPVSTPMLKSGYYFVNLTARDRAKPVLRRDTTWLFIVRGNPSKSRENK